MSSELSLSTSAMEKLFAGIPSVATVLPSVALNSLTLLGV